MFWQSLDEWTLSLYPKEGQQALSFGHMIFLWERTLLLFRVKSIKIKPKSVFIHIHQHLDSLKFATNKNNQAAKHIKWSICCLWKHKLPEMLSRLKYFTAYIKVHYSIKNCQGVLIDENCLICGIIYWKRRDIKGFGKYFYLSLFSGDFKMYYYCSYWVWDWTNP